MRTAIGVVAGLAWVSALSIGGPGAARAADTSAQGESLEEIVVTAQKRESTVQTTPISITAITGASLEDRGITDIQAVVQAVPGLSMRTSGPGQTELELRGLSSSGGNSSVVGFYLDDVPLSAPASAQNGKVVIDPSLYDLNRIEVLRGPQGTLYGSGSMGGTVKLIPNAPDPTAFDTSGEASFGGVNHGNSLNHQLSAMVNLPLSDASAVRVSGTLEHLSGWIDRIVIANGDFPTPVNPTTRGNVAAAPVAANFHDYNDENLRTLRVSLLMKLTDRLSVEPSFMYQMITAGGLNLIDSQPGTNATYQVFNDPEPFEDRIGIGALNVKYHFDFADLSSTGSYWSRDENLRQAGDEEIAEVLGLPYYTSQGGPGQNFPTSIEDDQSWQWSEELRLTSNGDGPFKWLLGYFYQDFESDWNLFVYTPFTAVPGTIPNAFTQYQPTQILQNSVFGEISYVWNDVTTTIGARRYYYKGTVNTAVSGWLSSSGTNDYAYFSTGERDQGATPKLNISYQMNKDLLVYGTAAEGFRPGGGNQPIPTTGSLGTDCLKNLKAIGLNGAPLGFKPDNVWSYELGEKFRGGDGRITINSAGYFENWQKIQQNIPLQCGFPFTSNAGNAHIYGAELEVDAVIVQGLVASVNGSFSHARYTANAVPSTSIDERVQNVPDVTLSGSLAYRRPVTDDLAFISRVDTNYVGSRIDTTAQANYLPPYDLTNLRMGFEVGGRWTAVLFANNVANRTAYLTNSPAINVNVPYFNRTAVAYPLTYGVDITYRMGAGGH